MLDGIIDIVKNQALEAISQNSDVPTNKKEAAIETTTSSIVDGIKSQLTTSNLPNLMNLFGGGSDSKAITDSIQGSVVSALSEKVGLNKDTANSIASVVIPAVISLISKKNNDSNDSFNLESLVESVAGKKGGGLLGALSSLFKK
ncbi:DUF937 domain-containing protein [Dysgonomonas sp. Marseille-P4677]|uniref:DUF937 domain-containing protein n=1 Tax=Dysgonomonas sp. Marseille-P4677 TaxID=2364790 RepID=UPI00191497A3|nr:DUF937 domain-containing protein [Dysgonomonas sp. Marseille-P4677]MBK5720682.1 DUF937 domain-containing protein [Dysgonomonas sp. Marseille-P4677]